MRILFLTPEFPFPPDSGGRIKTLSILDFLRARHEVRVLCFRRRPLTAEQERWSREIRGVESIPLLRGRTALNLLRSYLSRVPLSVERNRDPRMRQAVAHATSASAADALFVDGWLMAQYVPAGFVGLKLLHEHNAEYVMWRRQVSQERNPLLRVLVQAEYGRVRRHEASILPRFDSVFAVSEQDRQALVEIGADPSRTMVLPNLPDPALFERPSPSFEDTEPLVLYFGTLAWQPNLDGLGYFLRDVWPQVRAGLPDARFVLAGRDAPEWLERLAKRTPGVEFVGAIDDAEALYRRARAFVEATPSGGGTKLKILNALARGVPVVASPQAIEGIDVVPGEHVLVGDGTPTLVQAVTTLMTDRPTWEKVSASGRSRIRRGYLAEVAYKPLEEVLGDARATA